MLIRCCEYCLLVEIYLLYIAFNAFLAKLKSLTQKCHFVPLDNDESGPIEDWSNIDQSDGPAY